MATFDELKAAYNKLFAWIVDDGIPDGENDHDGVYRWKCDEWAANKVGSSPAGPFGCIMGPRFVCYLRPDQGNTIGWMKGLDFRSDATPESLLAFAASPPVPSAQFEEARRDEEAIRRFTGLMAARAKGRRGWYDMPATDLEQLLREHVEKGDMIDVANLAMMMHFVRERDARKGTR